MLPSGGPERQNDEGIHRGREAGGQGRNPSATAGQAPRQLLKRSGMDAVWPRMMVWAAGGTRASGGEHTCGGRLRLLAGAGQVCRGELPGGSALRSSAPGEGQSPERSLPPLCPAPAADGGR